MKRLWEAKYTIVIILVILILASLAGWSYYQFHLAQLEIKRLSTIEGKQQLAEKEMEELIAKVKSHMVLPDNEKPSVATVTDAAALKKEQEFFANAENGDSVLVYSQAKKAILYSPAKDVIVNVGFISLEGNPESLSQTVNIEIRNGTLVSGLGKKAADKLKQIKEIIITKVGDSSKKNYEKTVVVDLGQPNAKPVLDSLGGVFQGAELMNELPDGESSSSADILIIIGKDHI